MANYDLIVIGAGPAGYVAAIKAAQLGKKVACVDKDRTGGMCNNYGCIPTKALLRNAELYHTMKHRGGEFGFKIEGLSYDWSAIFQRSRTVSDKGTAGVDFLFKKNKIDSIRGEASMDKAGEVKVTLADGKTETHAAKNVLIATGCVSRPLPGLDFKGNTVIGSKEALALPAQPKSMVIIGAGAIGVEFAYFYNAFGTKVTLVEMLPQVLPQEDEDVSKTLRRSFEKQGIDLHVSTKVENVRVGKDSVKVDLVAGDKKTEVEAEVLLSAIGVVPNLEGALAANVKLELDRNYLKVDDSYQTNVKGIYAAGDIIGPPWLAHIATFEAVNAVNGMFGHGAARRVKNFPGCTYCQPQVASTGLTEKACKEKGLDYKVGKFPFTASGRAVASADSEGFVKVIADTKTGEIYGAHIIGSEATELIAEYGLAMELEATVEEIHQTIHAHPTLSEAVMEAAAASMGEAIHI